jgi:hypothetical protein
MIDVTEVLAGIVEDFEHTLHRLREEAQKEPSRIERPAPLVTRVRVEESELAEDEVFRWQRWLR